MKVSGIQERKSETTKVELLCYYIWKIIRVWSQVSDIIDFNFSCLFFKITDKYFNNQKNTYVVINFHTDNTLSISTKRPNAYFHDDLSDHQDSDPSQWSPRFRSMSLKLTISWDTGKQLATALPSDFYQQYYTEQAMEHEKKSGAGFRVISSYPQRK